MDNKLKENSPRILVISNNAFSKTSNNGKTLASFFKGFPSDNIAQLYINSEIPTNGNFNNFFRITDSEMINSFITRNNPGGIIECCKTTSTKLIKTSPQKKFLAKFRRYNLSKIGRELFWMNKRWNTELLNQWLTIFSPEITFFCAADTGFMYEINEYIHKKFKTKSVVYITDDYILPRKTISPFWWVRRNYIYNKMQRATKQSDLFVTISQEMKETYKELFGVDSILAMNMTESIKDKNIRNFKKRQKITLIYAGGLHFKRYETLNLLSKAILRYNLESTGKKAFLEIYSGIEPDDKVKRFLNIEGASKYCGSLNHDELKIILNECDIPVHVESFDRKSRESTRLSISTKIPEYLSLGKPVLAIGPEEVSSMKYLKDCAFCIVDSKEIYTKLYGFLNNEEFKSSLSTSALLKFEKYHDAKIMLNSFIDSMLTIVD